MEQVASQDREIGGKEEFKKMGCGNLHSEVVRWF